MQTKQNIDSICKKMQYRILPLIVVMFCLAFLDRSNISFVKHYIEVDVGISDTMYAMGAGLFFIGYALFEIPSNLLLHKFGAKIWLSRIMVSWGIITMCMVFIRNEISFYVLRFLLGLAEAGFSPGIILYLSFFFPTTHRSKAYGIYQMGVPLAFVLGGVFSGAILEYMPSDFIKNWQWMFLIQGFITIIVGIFAFFYLSATPQDSKWLSPQEKEVLLSHLVYSQRYATNYSLLDTFKQSIVWKFVFVYFCIQLSSYAVIFYLPSRIAEFLGSSVGFQVGVLNAMAWLIVCLSLPFITSLADKQRKWGEYSIVLLFSAICGILFATLSTNIVLFLCCISCACVGFIVAQPIFWNLSTHFFKDRSAATSIALIGSLGNLGGFIAPNLKSYVDSMYPNHGLIAIALIALFGVAMLLHLNKLQKGIYHGFKA